MSFHMCGFFSAVGASASNSTVAPITDNVLPISNNTFLLQEMWKLLVAIGFQADGTGARISTPDFRLVCLPHILPLNTAALPPDRAGIADYRLQPLSLPRLAALGVEASTSITGGNGTYLLCLQRQSRVVPLGDMLTLYGTSTTTLTANAWTSTTVTWEFNLPAGEYELVGMGYVGTNAQAVRAILPNQVERPGAVGTAAIGTIAPDTFRLGNMGGLGRFNSTALPILQCLANAADASHELFLDVVKVA